MRSSTLIAGLFAFAASKVAAQLYLDQSAPFYLVVLSPTDLTLNGSILEACHEGAAIEGLCVGGKLPATAGDSTYTFNTTSTLPSGPSGQPGFLTYELVGAGFEISEPMQLAYDPTTNVAVTLFEPSSSGTFVAFDDSDVLNIYGYYRWYVCTTTEGYTYTTLAWTLGKAAPENPTCVKVDVMRIFA